MPSYKSVQYSVWCDLCENLEDYQAFGYQKMAERAWKKLGWKKVDGIWVCPECVNAQQSAHMDGLWDCANCDNRQIGSGFAE